VLPIEWVGVTHIAAGARHAPVKLETGAIVTNLPTDRLFLFPQHRVLVTSAIVRRMFRCDSVFVAAKFLSGMKGVSRLETSGRVAHRHILCRTRAVVFAKGVAVEILLPGPVAMRNLPRLALTAIASITQHDNSQFAQPCLEAPAQPLRRELVARYVNYSKQLA